jgi:hypothetical protein
MRIVKTLVDVARLRYLLPHSGLCNVATQVVVVAVSRQVRHGNLLLYRI